MKKFLVLYKAPLASFEQMMKASPEQQKAGMDAWMAWAAKASASVVDLGAPLGKALKVTPSGARRVLDHAERVEGGPGGGAEGSSALHDAGRLHRGDQADADAGHVSPAPEL